jgi:hypothetical protein
MALGGFYMLYPSFPGETSFSTNHYEVGVHSFAAWHEPVIPNLLRGSPDGRYSVPLFQDASGLQQLPVTEDQIKALRPPIVDSHHQLSSRTELETTSKIYQQFLQKELPAFPKFVNIVI